MHRAVWLRALILWFAFGKVFALNLDSLPVWNPEELTRHQTVAEMASSRKDPPDIPERANRLETHGYKTMQVTVGDGGTQVDQELRLSIQGMVGDSVFIDALLSDVDRKAGDQTTAALQDVDQVYFRAESRRWMLHLGDLTWKDENLGLFSIERSTLGAMAGFRLGSTEVRGVAGTDEVVRMNRSMKGVSGQREGYSVSGSGEFLSIVPKSETVWMNGNRLVRDVDYDMNYAGGLLNFKGKCVPGPDDEIRVEYDAYEDERVYNLYAAKAKYRHPNVHLDVSGFRLENDLDRLKHGVWTDDDYKALKADRGGRLFPFDSALGGVDTSKSLPRPERIDRAGARMRLQAEHRYYADLEVAMNRKDSNTLSHAVEGPEGRAFRWFLTTDSSTQMRAFPVAFSIYGNRIEKEFEIDQFQGNDLDWNAYALNDEWDLSGDLTGTGTLRHDEFVMRTRLGTEWFADALWGYRQGAHEEWNSSRAKLSILHRNRDVSSEVDAVRVVSVQEREAERYQGVGKVQYLQGQCRPFANVDVRYTKVAERRAPEGADVPRGDALEDEILYGRGQSGVNLSGENWEASEAMETKLAKRRGDTYGDDWSDSLRSVTWTQTADYRSRFVDLTHFLQYERRAVDSSASENRWMGDINARLGDDRRGLSGNVNYKLGLTEEQTYTAVYKAVAPGTGDVRYDSLTGAFIEGVDNGDFVFEGMGRNDSVGAVRASNATFGMDVEWNPGLLFGIREGVLRDVTLGASYSAESEDTTGKTLYFPSVTPHDLRAVSSGNVSWDARLNWVHPLGISMMYRPGADYEKMLSSISYFETRFHHDLEAGFRFFEHHFVGATLSLESTELEALQNLEWSTRDISGRYRFSILEGVHVEPGGRYRTGSGVDDAEIPFDASLWEASMRIGYEKEYVVDAFARFSATQMESGGDAIPYQMMAGYSDGMTFRLEVSASVDVNDFISLGLHYVLRFGDAEENVFQKLSTEARAYF